MRSYDQYCAVARALDIVGDRWTLLIVRELLLRPCRYGELQDGLPGIATNLLAERLRQGDPLQSRVKLTRGDFARALLSGLKVLAGGTPRPIGDDGNAA